MVQTDEHFPPRTAFRQGLRDGAPFALAALPFGLVFGAIATEAGFNIAEIMGFSILVIAGASQLAAVQLMSENAPVIVVLLTGLAVNLRMAMYSASMAPHLGAATLWQRAGVAYLLVDQAYAVAHTRFDQQPDMPLATKLAYYAGAVLPICPVWYGTTLAGALLGATIPAGIPVDFAVPITFIAMIAPMLRTPAHVVAAFVSVASALAFGFVPYNLGLLIAAVLAMMAGARVEIWHARWLEARR